MIRPIPIGPSTEFLAWGNVATRGDGEWSKCIGLNPDGSEHWLDVEPPIGQHFWYWNGACYTLCYLADHDEDMSRFATDASVASRQGATALLESAPFRLYPNPQPVLPASERLLPGAHWYQAGMMYVWIMLGLLYNGVMALFFMSQADPARNDQWMLLFAPLVYCFGWAFFVAAIVSAVQHTKPHSPVGEYGFPMLAGLMAALVIKDHVQASAAREQQDADIFGNPMNGA